MSMLDKAKNNVLTFIKSCLGSIFLIKRSDIQIRLILGLTNIISNIGLRLPSKLAELAAIRLDYKSAIKLSDVSCVAIRFCYSNFRK